MDRLADFLKSDGAELARSFAAGACYAAGVGILAIATVHGSAKLAGVTLPALSNSIFHVSLPNYAPRNLASLHTSKAAAMNDAEESERTVPGARLAFVE